MKTRDYVTVALLSVLTVVTHTQTAQAGGLTLLDRGARALSRGGAFVAGVDDPSALWYNPAGLSESKNQVLTDSTLTLLFASYQRQYADGTYSDKVDAKPMPLPIPTLAFSHNFGLKNVTFGAGIFAPNTIIQGWPRSVGHNGVNLPSPTRYSLLNLKGSILSNLAVGLAYHGIKGLSIGADVQAAVGRFKADVALSSCGDGIVCNFPEDPEFDAYTSLDVLPAFGFTGVLGVKYNLADMWRIGASVMLPYSLHGPATINTKLPDNPLFENAHVEGSKADFKMNYPLIVRVGSEIRPWRPVRLEGAFVWEQWSSQKSIDVTPRGVRMVGVRGIGDYDIGPIKIQRDMRNVWSVRGGYEIFIPPKFMLFNALKHINYAMRGGLAYERSAFSNKTLTPLTLDANKVLISGGMAFDLTHTLRFESVIGWYIMKNVTVTNSTIQRPQAIRPASTADNVTVGNGIYTMEAIYLGGGFSLRLD